MAKTYNHYIDGKLVATYQDPSLARKLHAVEAHHREQAIKKIVNALGWTLATLLTLALTLALALAVLVAF